MSDSDNAPLKVIINGQEFDETEAQDLIDTGRKTREMETKWNTKLDSVWPEYGQTRQQLKQYEAELAEAKAQLTEFQSKKAEGSETPQDVQEAQEAARKLGLTLKDDIDKAGFIKKDELDSYLSQREQENESRRKASESVLAEADKLAKDIDGSDGRPKFNKRAVIAYASQFKIGNLLDAYEDMHNEDLEPWKQRQIDAQKNKSLKTLNGGGAKEPKSPRISSDNFGQAFRESVYGSDE